MWRPSTGSWYVRDGEIDATLVNGVPWGQFGDCPIAGRLLSDSPGSLQLNVWRPSNGVWYFGRSFTGTGGLTLAFGTYGDLPFGPDMDGDADGDFGVFRPSTGTWYGQDPTFSVAWGQPGDIPVPRSARTGVQPSVLSVYRAANSLTYNCFSPLGRRAREGRAPRVRPGPRECRHCLASSPSRANGSRENTFHLVS